MRKRGGINITVSRKFISPGSLNRQKAGYFFIFFRPSKVYFFVGGIYIAADNQFFSLEAQRFQKIKESVIEIQLVFRPFLTLLSIRKIDVAEGEARVLRDNNPAFCVKCLYPETISYFYWFLFGYSSNTGITCSGSDRWHTLILVSSPVNRFNHLAALAKICSAVFAQTNGLAPSFHRLRKALIAPTRWPTLPKLPRRIAWLVSIPNQISTMFIQEAAVGVK